MMLMDSSMQKKLKSYFTGWLFIPSDDTVDSIINETIANLTKLSYGKLGLEEDDLVRAPMTVFGPRTDHQGGVDIIYKKGTDGEVRYSLVDVAVLHFTKDRLCVYRCALDLVGGRTLNTAAKEYFYKDIVSVSIETESAMITKKRDDILGAMFDAHSKNMYNIEKFVLKNSGAESMVINISNGETSGNNEHTEDFSSVVTAVRKLIQNKK